MPLNNPAFNRASLDAALAIVGARIPATLQDRWTLLEKRLGAEVWVKHENHTTAGAFKVRGGLTYFDALLTRQPDCKGLPFVK